MEPCRVHAHTIYGHEHENEVNKQNRECVGTQRCACERGECAHTSHSPHTSELIDFAAPYIGRDYNNTTILS